MSMMVVLNVARCMYCSPPAYEELTPWHYSVEGSTQCKYGWLPLTTGVSQSQHAYSNVHSLSSQWCSVSDLRYTEQELQHRRCLMIDSSLITHC